MGDSPKSRLGAVAARFASEEPPSFCSRATPVVPYAQTVVENHDGPTASGDIADSGVVKRARASVRDSNGNLPSIPPRLSDHEFWHAPVGYSEPPAVLLSEPVRQQPSAARSAMARTVFAVVLLLALVLLGYALSALAASTGAA
jgi:hypothetical protein